MLGALPILPLPAPPPDGDLGPLPPSQVTEQQKEEIPVSEEQSKAISTPASVATHTRTIGIIHPPPDIRNIVDKTSQFVAKNGPEFEKRIIANNANNAKFNFLNSLDPYHAYYQHRLSEFRAQNQSSSQLSPSQLADSDVPMLTPSDPATDGNEATEKPDPTPQFKPSLRKVLEPPEAEHYTVRLPEGNPPTGLTEKLKASVADMTTVLERCLHRLEWERSQEQARQKAEDEIEQERMLMAMIDWHDFVVVETVDFADDEDEDLPPPMTLEEVIRRSKISTMEEDEIVETGKEIEMEMDE
ncbi:hypothetical protein Q3G72_016793 [Acer saccharum]|nr:hypothetical protein Q3G72_016793 [Acer saccharum]